MKNLIFYGLVLTILFSCAKEESTPLNKIEFKATCDTECYVSAFIDRGGELIWQENPEFKDEFYLEKKTVLKPDDKVLLFVSPKDGKTHYIQTEILIDGVKVANQNKVCHAGGGCSSTIE